MEEFFMVSFERDGNFYFFHDYENACAFIMESFCDEFPDATNEEIGKANKQLADECHIENYVWCDRVCYED